MIALAGGHQRATSRLGTRYILGCTIGLQELISGECTAVFVAPLIIWGWTANVLPGKETTIGNNTREKTGRRRGILRREN